MPSTALYNFTQIKLEPVRNPDLARMISVPLKASTTFKRGTILGEITASKLYAPYASGASDGTQVPKLILAYDCITDANGNPTGVTYPYPPFPGASMEAYARGEFDCATVNTAMGDSGTLLTAALAAGLGHLVEGVVTTGSFIIG